MPNHCVQALFCALGHYTWNYPLNRKKHICHFDKDTLYVKLHDLWSTSQIFEEKFGRQIPLIKRECCSMLESLVQAYITTWHFFAYIERKLAKILQLSSPVNTAKQKPCEHLPYTLTDLRHDSLTPHTSLNTKTPSYCKTQSPFCNWTSINLSTRALWPKGVQTCSISPTEVIPSIEHKL